MGLPGHRLWHLARSVATSGPGRIPIWPIAAVQTAMSGHGPHNDHHDHGQSPRTRSTTRKVIMVGVSRWPSSRCSTGGRRDPPPRDQEGRAGDRRIQLPAKVGRRQRSASSTSCRSRRQAPDSGGRSTAPASTDTAGSHRGKGIAMSDRRAIEAVAGGGLPRECPMTRLMKLSLISLALADAGGAPRRRRRAPADRVPAGSEQPLGRAAGHRCDRRTPAPLLSWQLGVQRRRQQPGAGSSRRLGWG